MGSRGPAPKRDSQRRRENKPDVPTTEASTPEPTIPESNPAWHPIARQWFESLALSGQSAFYSAGDWMTAFAVAESMSREFKPQPVVQKDGPVLWVEFPPKAAALMGWLKACSILMVCEGDRRRLRLELHRPSEESTPDVSELAEYRSRLSS